MRIIGIDCATQAAKTGLALGTYGPGGLNVEQVVRHRRWDDVDRQLVDWLSVRPTLIALDAPLGWPVYLGDALASHRAGEVVTAPADQLFNRTTDRYLYEICGKRPLDVGADRIARTAHAALGLLERMRSRKGLAIPLAWSPDEVPGHRVAAIEVYPAATLTAHSGELAAFRGYKQKGGLAERRALLRFVAELCPVGLSPSTMVAAEESDDLVDAVLCLLAGRDFLAGSTIGPDEAGLAEMARQEGWIWFKSVRT